MTHLVAPSLLSANFLELGKDIQMLNESKADWLHIDVMDGKFVPNISFGFPVIKFIKKAAQKPLDVHLMIEQPERYIREFKEVGADILTVHLEASTHLHRTIQQIKSAGMKAGVSLNPHSPVNLLQDIIEDVDLVLIMSVNPGYGGQAFIEKAYSKIISLKKMILSSGSKAKIEVDGGVDNTNASNLVAKGADVLVAGSYVFKSADPSKTIERLKFLK